MGASSPYCPMCGALNAAEAETCFACGKALPLAESEAVGTKTRTLSGKLLPRQMLKLRFRILKRIGEGGFGAVYQGEDTEAGNRLVAIKEMSHDGLSPQDLQEATDAFHREAQFLMELTHSSLPHIYGHFSEGGNWYLVMDFIKGETLEEHLARQGGHLPLKDVLDLGIKLCDVLEYLHARQPPVVFRDLKPGNVILTPDHRVYLIDFGIARHFTPGKPHDTIAFGSPGYAAPEQYGKAQTTPRSDIYSLGALLHQLLTSDDPANSQFHFAPLHMRRPVGLSALIERMVELDQEKRPASMQAVRDELKRMSVIWEEDQRQQATTVSTATSISAAARVSPPVMPQSAGAPTSPKPVSSSRAGTITGWSGVGGVMFLFICFALAILAGQHSSSSVPTYPTYSLPASTVTQVSAVAWSPDGKYLADTRGAAVEVRGVFADFVEASPVETYPGDSSTTDWLAWSPNGTRIASAYNDGTASVWEALTGKTIATFRGHMARVSELSWSPDGLRVVSASDDGTVHIWDATDGTNLLTYTQHTDKVWTVAWSPDGKWIASAGADKIARVWDPTTGKTRLVYPGHSGAIGHLSWSPDSTRIASASEDGTVQVWDATTGATLATYSALRSNANAVAWSPDGMYIASSSLDGTVTVWKAATAQEVYIYYNDHSGQIGDVSWSPDSKRIASCSNDGTLQIWDALTGANVVTIEG